MWRPTTLISVAMVGLLAAAPVPKGKPVPDEPPTDAQLAHSAANLRVIGDAFRKFHEDHSRLPTGLESKEGKPLLSWRVEILQCLGEEDLYKQFKLDEPWDSEHNKKLIDKMPKVFAPVRGKFDKGLTFYQGFAGKRGLLNPGETVRFATVRDGLANTLLVAEAARPVEWTRPADPELGDGEVPAMGGLFDGRFHGVMVSGAVHQFRKNVPAPVLRRLIDPNDGEVIDFNQAFDRTGKE